MKWWKCTPFLQRVWSVCHWRLALSLVGTLVTRTPHTQLPHWNEKNYSYQFIEDVKNLQQHHEVTKLNKCHRTMVLEADSAHLQILYSSRNASMNKLKLLKCALIHTLFTGEIPIEGNYISPFTIKKINFWKVHFSFNYINQQKFVYRCSANMKKLKKGASLRKNLN